MKKTYYLFGQDACDEYDENGIEGVVSRIKNNDLSYSAFEFIEGVTPSCELAEALDGWDDYAIITPEEYNQL